MDEIEEYLSHYTGELDQEAIEARRNYLSGLSKEEFYEIRTRDIFNKNLESDFMHAQKEQPDQWRIISNKISETTVLIYIYNNTHETFSLTDSSWTSTDPAEFDIQPGSYISLTLPSELLRRISSGKAAFKSSQVSHWFVYHSGDYAFDFVTSAVLSRGYEPFAFRVPPKVSRKHTIRSTGHNALVCEYILEQNKSVTPYSYAISIKISQPR